jgi:predicted NBD/HSP70 family sugar kinase
MRQHNLALVLRHVADTGKASRAAIAASVGLTKATVSSLVEELIAAGLLVAAGLETTGEVGRPGTALSLNTEGPAGVGLEINVDYLTACVVDLAGQPRRLEVRRGDNRGVARDQVLRAAADLLREVIDEVRALGLRPVGLNVAVPGTVSRSDGRLAWAPNLGWTDVPVLDELRAAGLDDVPALGIGNEANLAALGELWYGGGAGWGDFVQISGEVGIGAGIVVGGQLFGGSHGFAGELGHVVVEPDGPSCACGARGCLERYAGQEALTRRAGRDTALGTSVGDPTGAAAALVEAASEGDASTRDAIARAGWALGVALTGLVNIVDPDTLVLGGLYARLAPWLIDPLREQLAERAPGGVPSPVRVEVSRLGPYAAVRGAAGLVVDRLIANPLGANVGGANPGGANPIGAALVDRVERFTR